MQIMVSRRSSCKSFTGFYRFSLVFQWSLNDLSIIFQWSSPKMWQFLRDCRKVIERLVRPLSAHWEIAGKTAERPLKDHFHERLPKDYFWTLSKKIGDHGDHEIHWKNHLGIMKDPRRSLKVHWKTIERSSKFSWSFSGLLLSVEWGFNWGLWKVVLW